MKKRYLINILFVVFLVLVIVILTRYRWVFQKTIQIDSYEESVLGLWGRKSTILEFKRTDNDFRATDFQGIGYFKDQSIKWEIDVSDVLLFGHYHPKSNLILCSPLSFDYEFCANENDIETFNSKLSIIRLTKSYMVIKDDNDAKNIYKRLDK